MLPEDATSDSQFPIRQNDCPRKKNVGEQVIAFMARAKSEREACLGKPETTLCLTHAVTKDVVFREL